MGGSVNFPSGREGASAAGSVADFLDGLVLPTVDPVVEELAALPGYPPLPSPDGSGGWSQLDGARALMAGCLDAAAALRRHQNRCAALMAVTVEHLETVAAAEGGLLGLDPWQKGMLLQQTQAELALVLGVSEGATARLVEHAKALVRDLPATLGRMRDGSLGWDHAVVIADECRLLRTTGIGQDAIDAFEQELLEKAEGSRLPSFREKARRLRERRHPGTIPERTRRALKDRRLGIGRSSDGMSWLSLYGPAPAMEAIWDRCTLTAQAAQGPHEPRTLTQLRADIATILLLGQTMNENHIHTPPTRADDSAGRDQTAGGGEAGGGDRGRATRGTGGGHGGAKNGPGTTHNGSPRPEGSSEQQAGPAGENSWFPDPGDGAAGWGEGQVPAFEDPDYTSPDFQEPPPPDDEVDYWDRFIIPLTPAPAPEPGPGSGGARGPTMGVAGVFAPLPQVMPVVLIPLLGLLGETDDPAWMEGAGPISMDIAQRMAAKSPSIYRLLVDPVTNTPLGQGAECYRITQAMRTMLQARDEYCQFPGCPNKASTSDLDHLQAFSAGGKTTPANLEHLCRRHHHIKHFKDDKNRHGQPRSINEPERQNLPLRGWTPHRGPDNRITWTTPTGQHCRPEPHNTPPPSYPTWLKQHLTGQSEAKPQDSAAIQKKRPDFP